MISFIRYRRATTIFSLCIMALFVAVFFYKMHTRGYAFTYSVDFTGGTQVLLGFDKPLDVLLVKNALQAAGFESVSARDFGKNEILVRVKNFSDDSQGVAQKMAQVVRDSVAGYEVT